MEAANPTFFEEPEEHSKTLADYFSAFREHKVLFLTPLVGITLVSVLVAMKLPPVYQSTGTILIEQQEVPVDLVQTTVTSYADERIQVISQRVLTTANLSRILEAHDLYLEERQHKNLNQIVARMRDEFTIDLVSGDVRDQRSGRARIGTIAFNLSYQHESPAAAQRIANELVSLYLGENLKVRTQAAVDTAAFLGAEASKLGAELSELERKIAAFKQENVGRLPEQLDLNIQLMDRAEQSLLETERQIQMLETQRTYLDTVLRQTRDIPQSGAPQAGPDAIDPAQARLESLRLQYTRSTAIYSPDHPDAVKLRKEIEALEKEGAGNTGVAVLEQRLAQLKLEMAAAAERYSKDHPDVRKLQREAATLEEQLRTEKQETRSTATSERRDAADIELMTQLQTTKSELQSLRERRELLREKVASYEQRIMEAPQIERGYRRMVRDHENVMAKYKEIKAKQSSARVAEALEKERKGERFTLIEPPRLPTEPIKPNRPKIMALGLALAGITTIGGVIVTETLFDVVRGTGHVRFLLGAPPLAVIPSIASPRDLRRRRRSRWGLVVLGILLLAAAVTLVHFFHTPLDVLWFKSLDKLNQVLERLSLPFLDSTK